MRQSSTCFDVTPERRISIYNWILKEINLKIITIVRHVILMKMKVMKTMMLGLKKVMMKTMMKMWIFQRSTSGIL